MSDQPSLSEILRRLDDNAKSMERLVEKFDALASTLEDKYVPRREYDLRVGELEKDQEANHAFRRQVAAGFLVGLLMMIAAVLAAVAGLPGAG